VKSVEPLGTRKGKINELETNNKNKTFRDLYRGINEFKKEYQPRINIIKDENCNLLADSQSVLNRWKHFCNRGTPYTGGHFHTTNSPRGGCVHLVQMWPNFWLL
jgi:hypothetical protein